MHQREASTWNLLLEGQSVPGVKYQLVQRLSGLKVDHASNTMGNTPLAEVAPCGLRISVIVQSSRSASQSKAAALLAVSLPMDSQVADADTVKDVLCELQRVPGINLPKGAVAALQAPEDFTCDFTQTHAAAYIDSLRWAFVFPHADQGKTFERQNTEDFIKFTREGQYLLFVYQTGKKPNEPGWF